MKMREHDIEAEGNGAMVDIERAGKEKERTERRRRN